MQAFKILAIFALNIGLPSLVTNSGPPEDGLTFKYLINASTGQFTTSPEGGRMNRAGSFECLKESILTEILVAPESRINATFSILIVCFVLPEQQNSPALRAAW